MLYDKNGRAFELGDEAGFGREGSTYHIVGEPFVAKIYHNATPQITRKIESMASILSVLFERKKQLLLKLAWPLGALYERSDGRGFKGYFMYGVPEEFVSIDAVSQFPRSPAAPAMTERQKIELLIELCELTSGLHGIGITVGDWNPRNILVGENGSLMLLDTDSYGFTLSDEAYGTTCAAPGFIAPEVLKLMESTGIGDFEGLAAAKAPVFTPQTDDFALAVHIFKMLNRGVHPFSGDLDTDFFDLDDDDIPPAPSLNTCIRNGQSPFIGTQVGYAVPDYALGLNDFPFLLSEAFRRSLYDNWVEERISARVWARLLDRYLSQAIECPRGHLYRPDQHECPYCKGDRALLARLG